MRFAKSYTRPKPVRKVSRTLELIAALQNRPKDSLASIAREFDVTRQAVYAALERASAAGMHFKGRKRSPEKNPKGRG